MPTTNIVETIMCKVINCLIKRKGTTGGEGDVGNDTMTTPNERRFFWVNS